MPRKTTSQWEFGDLFRPAGPGKPSAAPPEPVPARRIFSVTDLTAEIKSLLEQRLGEISVSGEITNLRAQASGHLYFTLKDAGAQLSCVLFRGTPSPVRGSLRDGVKVVLSGNLSVYEPRGQYQLIVRVAELQGIGALQAAFERLKLKLQAEGLFDTERKRPLPRLPRRLGLVTSPTGAALRDVLHVIQRRFAGLEVVLAASRVQGQGAELEIAEAIRRLNRWSREPANPHGPLDVLLVTRGGGSLEDLWAFNEEAVARAIFESQVPVVSAVGHEIDFTIADFVADLRAATPSAAAEILTAGYVASREEVEDARARLRREIAGALEDRHGTLETLAARLSRGHPRRRLEDRAQRIDELALTLARRASITVAGARRTFESARARLVAVRPTRSLLEARRRLERPATELSSAARRRVGACREKLERLDLRLRLLDPGHTLARGYSITTEAASGRVIREADSVPVGTTLLTRLASGRVRSVSVPLSPDAPGLTTGTNQPSP